MRTPAGSMPAARGTTVAQTYKQLAAAVEHTHTQLAAAAAQRRCRGGLALEDDEAASMLERRCQAGCANVYTEQLLQSARLSLMEQAKHGRNPPIHNIQHLSCPFRAARSNSGEHARPWNAAPQPCHLSMPSRTRLLPNAPRASANHLRRTVTCQLSYQLWCAQPWRRDPNGQRHRYSLIRVASTPPS